MSYLQAVWRTVVSEWRQRPYRRSRAAQAVRDIPWLAREIRQTRKLKGMIRGGM